MQYSVILGKDVSQTARSPAVWNAWYSEMEIPRRMIPINIDSKDEFDVKIRELEADPNCLGGAVAVPCKTLAARYIKTRYSAINCFYRSKSGHFLGENTDGVAGAQLITENLPAKHRLLVLGFGETFKAIFRNLGNDVRENITIFQRQPSKSTAVDIQKIDSIVNTSDNFCVFNATTAGGPIAPNELPVAADTIMNMKRCRIARWIDINNQQKPISAIQKSCDEVDIEFISGNSMNVTQARIAFQLVNN